MKMNTNHKGSFHSNSYSTPVQSTGYDSMNSSFYSTSSWDSSSYPGATTPSTRRTSVDSIKIEQASFTRPTPSGTPDRYGNTAEFLQLSSMTGHLSPGFHDPMNLLAGGPGKLMHEHNMMDANEFAPYTEPMCNNFDSQQSLPTSTPSLDLSLSSPNSITGCSPVSMDFDDHFVVPSQTTFLDNFDMQSPMRPMKSLQFDIQYDSPISDYATDFAADYSIKSSPDGSMKYFSPVYIDSESASVTPSRSFIHRQPMLDTLSTSTALHRVQQLSPSDKQTQAARHERRRAKREVRRCLPCQFCEKSFNRSDNLKSHIKLHADPYKKSSRTMHCPEAIRVYAEMNKKPRKSGEVSTKRDAKFTRSRVTGY